MTIEVVRFSIRGVPDNWLNVFDVGFSSREYAAKRRYKSWIDDVILFGRMARTEAGWPLAEKENAKRNVQVHQIRHGELDEDGLQASCKPLYDGLKRWLFRVDRKASHGSPRVMKKYEGAGLLWDDTPAYCHMLEPTQVKVGLRIDPITTITVSKDE